MRKKLVNILFPKRDSDGTDKPNNSEVEKTIEELEAQLKSLKQKLEPSKSRKTIKTNKLPVRIKIYIFLIIGCIIFFLIAWIINKGKINYCSLSISEDIKGCHMAVNSPVEYISRVNYPFFKGDTVFVFLKFSKLPGFKEPLPFASIVAQTSSNNKKEYTYKLKVFEKLNFNHTITTESEPSELRSGYIITKIVKLNTGK